MRIIGSGNLPPYNLEGALVQVNNYGGVRTNAQGNFTLNGIPPGVYPVELDPEGLPPELILAKSTVIAQVVGGAVTTLDFELRPEFGIAGRVTDAAGQPVMDTQVELLNSAGDRLKLRSQIGLASIG